MEVLLKRWVMRDGQRTLVSECEATGVPGAPGTSCLIWESDSAMRRIWNYPVDWHRMDDAQVLALFDQPYAATPPVQPASQTRPARPRREGSASAGQIETVAWL